MGEVGNVFHTDDWWKPSSLFVEPSTIESTLFPPVELDIASIRFAHPYAPKHDLEHELRLPDLDTFEFGPLPELERLEESTISCESLSLPPQEDIWQAASELGPVDKDVLFHTWENFEQGYHSQHRSPYITECGPSTFDAALTNDDEQLVAGRVLNSDILLQSLWNLGLGRSSTLFQFNANLKTFEARIALGRPSGVSLCASQSLITQFIHTGNTFLYLKAFSERTFASATSIPARTALATCVSSILTSLENALGKRSTDILSLIQLQHHFATPRQILIHVAKAVDAAKYAKTNEHVSSILHHRLLESEEGTAKLRQLSCEVLRQVARPSLELIGEWIGITMEQTTNPIWARDSFISVEDAAAEPKSLEFTYRSELMPRFITPEDGNTIFEVGNSLHFLKTQHPEHPLVSFHRSNVTRPELEWGFSWRDIERLAQKARAYEKDLQNALLAFGHGLKATGTASRATTKPGVPDVHESLQDLEQYFLDSIRTMDALPTDDLRIPPDELHSLVDCLLQDGKIDDSLTSDTFSPPLSLLSALSFRPLITAQAALVNAATIRFFFRAHDLKHHLTLQRQYHLLGDGVFSSLLATALFDPNRESAERRKGQMRSGVHMGLQLGSRKTWPPASSELRLALRGVLSESYFSSSLYQSAQRNGDAMTSGKLVNGRDHDELPGQLNFAVRNLTEVEQEQVMDPDALSALDFLRLQYVAPTPLNMIITNTALDKYDLIFKFLLRLLRMLFVVSHLPREFPDSESRQLRVEAHHFVSVFANYVFQTGIAEHWDRFHIHVATIEAHIDEEDNAGEIGMQVTEGVASLRNAHENCLDSIMFSLLLRKRQRKIIALVDEIFDYILLFAKMQNHGLTIDVNVKELNSRLRGKIRVFLSVCRGLTAKQSYGKEKGTAEENSIERLVLSMEMNGYFAGP